MSRSDMKLEAGDWVEVRGTRELPTRGLFLIIRLV